MPPSESTTWAAVWSHILEPPFGGAVIATRCIAAKFLVRVCATTVRTGGVAVGHYHATPNTLSSTHL